MSGCLQTQAEAKVLQLAITRLLHKNAITQTTKPLSAQMQLDLKLNKARCILL